ncbi:EAL domain-containing protein [Herbaspirillum sp. alder98]|uniref:EAL domain-containing protein n=1 Tax=Herbaspirillum sp. alder98 TaxID=2913096 RepID=UPI001CD84DDF|nr:EAL domain-containing protein [Herbaspirillum sp. alder98]MCA1327039.1 EAL domain-containing protein [Herbaspirillum sp. alder98]
MQLTRHSVLATAVVLGIVCLVLPGALAWTWSWQRAEAGQRAELTRLTEAAAQRSHAIVKQASVMLDGLDVPSGRRCSEADISRMRARTIDIRVIEEIGYQRDGQLLCNSWGAVNQTMRLSPSYTTAGPGLQLRTANFSLASPRTRLVSVTANGYYAYVEPGRFVDIALPGHVWMTVSTAAGEPITGKQPAGGKHVAMFNVEHADAVFRIVAGEPMQQVEQEATRLRWTLLPLAALFSAAGLGGIAMWLRRRLSLAGELRAALDRGELQVYYQPIVELASGHCIGAEALARWQHPTGRWIAADVFIAEAEQHGLIGRITVQVIQAVIRDMGPLLRRQPDMHVSVNLSAQDIDDDSARQVLSTLMALHGVAASQIWLEMTERGFINTELARSTIGGLRTRQHQILIDDFGTGYSSLSYLQTLPVDGLKIDKSFVDMITSDAAASGVIDHIIDMAKSLGLVIVAEGVETAPQAEYLRRRQVEFAQGWLFAKAMPADQFRSFYQARAASSPMGDPGQDQRNRG